MNFFRKKAAVIPPLLLLCFLLFWHPSLFQTTPAFAATNAIVQVYPNVTSATTVGQNVSISVNLGLAYNFTGYLIRFKFNTTLLHCLSASGGSMPTTQWITIINNSIGTVFVQSSAGDINRDGLVNLQDLVILALAYLSTPGSHNWNPAADVNGDGVVGLTDLVYMAKNYLRQNIPNPTGNEQMLNLTFNATYGAPYLQHATGTFEILNSTIYGPGTPPQIIPYTSINGTYYSPYNPPSSINLTLTTNLNSYTFNQNITISGTLKGDGSPVPDALIALEIRNASNPNAVPIVFRTLTTSSFYAQFPVQIISVTPCLSDGTPQTNFTAAPNNIVFFSVIVNNNGPPIANATIWVNAFDSSNTTLGTIPGPQGIISGVNPPVIVGIPLDYNDTIGTATAYASVMTGLVENGGIPLCFESRATFYISGNTTGTPAFMSQPPTGSYMTILKIQWGPSSSGTYTVYAATKYMGLYSIKITTFQITP